MRHVICFCRVSEVLRVHLDLQVLEALTDFLYVIPTICVKASCLKFLQTAVCAVFRCNKLSSNQLLCILLLASGSTWSSWSPGRKSMSLYCYIFVI